MTVFFKKEDEEQGRGQTARIERSESYATRIEVPEFYVSKIELSEDED